MNTRYYLSLFPIEALIASNLDPTQFGVYMATGSKHGSYEDILFLEIEGCFGSSFDWDYANAKCVPHENGDPKHSLYLSVYRTLENVPLTAFKSLFLTTRDGRTLELGKAAVAEAPEKRDYWVYQELCPIRPLAVSTLDPQSFAGYMTDAKNKTWVPKIVFTDLKVTNSMEKYSSGDPGVYDRNLEHLKECINVVKKGSLKPNKIVDRSHVDRFTYLLVGKGFYVGDGKTLITYPMKSIEDLKRNHFDWGRSARFF